MRLPVPLARLLSGQYRRAPELRILALSVVLAVASLSSVGFFTDRVQRAMSMQSAELLGADLVIDAAGAIDVTARGFAGGRGPGTPSEGARAGGGYGGQGGRQR